MLQSHATSTYIKQSLMLESHNLSSSDETSPQVTQPLIKSRNPPHQLISIIPLQMLSSFSFSSHLALSKYFPSTNKVKYKTTKREIQTTFPGRGKMWLSKGQEEGEWGRSTGRPLSRESFKIILYTNIELDRFIWTLIVIWQMWKYIQPQVWGTIMITYSISQ